MISPNKYADVPQNLPGKDVSKMKRLISVDYSAVMKELDFLKYINDNPTYYQSEANIKRAVYRYDNKNEMKNIFFLQV